MYLSFFNTGGGGGGGGGAGAIASGPATTLTNSATGIIAGGTGGAALASSIFVERGGSGGGGVGVRLDGATLVNTGQVTGGDGGDGRGQYYSGSGGAGVIGTGNATIINAGHIAGGWQIRAGETDTQADAVELLNGGNRLELQAGATFEGLVLALRSVVDTDDVLALGGDLDASFDLGQLSLIDYRSAARFQGFDTFEKSGAGTWTLTGSSDATYGVAQDWTVTAGTLLANGTLPASGLAAAGTMQVSGGVLGGIGQTYATTVHAGGTLAPGDASAPCGTLQIVGDTGLEPASALAIRSSDGNDCAAIEVDGALAIGGVLNVHFDASPQPGATCTIATASGAISGSFSQVDAGTALGSVTIGAHAVSFTVTGTDVIFRDGFEGAAPARWWAYR